MTTGELRTRVTRDSAKIYILCANLILKELSKYPDITISGLIDVFFQ